MTLPKLGIYGHPNLRLRPENEKSLVTSQPKNLANVDEEGG